MTIRDIFDTGIRPITMATDLLKPGGYLRLSACMRELESSDAWGMEHVDVARLDRLAEEAVTMAYTQKHWKPEERIDVAGGLPLTDCYVAPCITACAIKQDIPEYIRLLGEQRYADALELIYQRNALPAITGHICDHQCQYNCTRLDYDSALNIRELKKIALEKAMEQLNKIEQEKKEAIVKSKTDAVKAVVKDEKQAAVVVKAALALDNQEDFDALIAVFKSMNDLLEKSGLFQEQGVSAEASEDKPGETKLMKALKARHQAKQ